MSKTQIVTGGIADDAVSEEHLDATAITGHTALGAEPADTDELLVSDAGTLKRMDYSYIKSSSAFTSVGSSSGTTNVDIVSLGQYLRPTLNHHPIDRWVTPKEFDLYRKVGLKYGFLEVISSPMARSSYRAERALDFNNAGIKI